MSATVSSLHLSAEHGFVKPSADSVELVAGIGVEGDAHSGATTQHLSRKKKDPNRPNLRQVHLVAAELHDELRAAGFDVEPGQFGENLTTRGLVLGELPTGTVLALGDDALIALTGFRDPCAQIDDFRSGLRAAVSFKPESGPQLFREGVMAVVLRSGTVRVGDAIRVAMPPEPHHPMRKV